ncbi:ABC transporter permease [Aerococcus christensenii]|uniref:ABC transporter permease n=1 Tax=Aerococcus christensenii TaxID=87541 RepID=A0A0X8F7N9_9LACT|nr:oligopeptide ABC transporter permease [Aerococcus christensenii]AMB92134.1 peptide ABC transporter permease [Aerococcus christensenii]KXB37279.1 putative oligopeptide transport system permease protein OppB [Aerococcus christensenii]MDK8234301.1 ABC transporter permease [Aerococcus christensenii]PKY92136.1 ABC transporter permease [Aerococcus christensenii]WEB70720.1 ABC transporter permease [Aerococcus christensenii]
MKSYGKFLLRRIFFMILTLFLIATITFFLMKLLPGTPYSNEDKLSPEQIYIMNERYGLNDPIFVQYIRYIFGMVKGDFGISFQFNNTPVSELLGARIWPSIQLGAQALVLGTVIGTVFGVLSAMYRNTWIDSTLTFLSILGQSIPNFVFAVLLQLIFAVKLGWFPIALWDKGFASSILPTIALAISPLANSARFVRTEMVDVLNSDYIELARAKGLSRTAVAFKHGVRNALIPLVTILGPLSVALMTGSMVVENIFAIPGIGEQFVKSITTNDYSTIMGMTMFYSTSLVVILLIVDILYGIIDPRIRVASEGEN